jgi:hypothetical protein
MRDAVVLVTASVAFFACVRLDARASGGFRRSVLRTSVTFGILLVLLNEAMSLVSMLTLPSIALLWSVAVAALLFHLARKDRATPERAGRVGERGPGLPWTDRILLAGALGVAGVLAVMAWYSAPSNWDSMTYHLSRVMHWIQNRGFRYFPTPNLRELHFAPWAEMAILDLRILAGGDRLAGFVQYASFLGTALGVSEVARRLGGSRRCQIVAAVLTMTLPMAILQSCTTQNDLVATYWFVCFITFLPPLAPGEPVESFRLGGALGLALLSKSSVSFFALPFVAWIAIDLVRRSRLAAWRPLGATALVVILVNAPFIARNLAAFGKPFGLTTEGTYTHTNTRYSPGVAVSNLVRNLALHTGVTTTAAARTENAVRRVHAWLGLDADDPATTWPGERFHVPTDMQESVAGNPWHLLLLLVLVPPVFFRAGSRWGVPGIYAACLGAGLLLFSLLLQWQPWHSRLHLPFFAAALPLAVASSVLASRPRLLAAVAAVFLVLCVNPLFGYSRRQLTGDASLFVTDRTAQMFFEKPELREPYTGCLQRALEAKCRRVGLMIGGEDWEYPLWKIGQALDPAMAFEHVVVKNASREIPLTEVPCAVISTRATNPKYLEAAGTRFWRAWSAQYATLYLSGAEKPEAAAPPSLVFTDGWHGEERSAGTWHRWCSGVGELLVDSATGGKFRVEGVVFSHAYPNEVELTAGQGMALRLQLPDGPVGIDPPLVLSLEPGTTRLVFRSRNPAGLAPPDTRDLAFAVRGLSFRPVGRDDER